MATCRSIKTFEEVFSPLAHHLFPDGCPKNEFESTSGTSTISKHWPRRSDRTIVSVEVAIQSISNIRQYSQLNGCYPHELIQLCIVACATLPSEEYHEEEDIGCSRITSCHSRLIDGTSYYFIRILQCMVPCGSHKDPECIPPIILRKLLSVASSIKCDTDGKCAVLRFLTLVVQSGCLRFSNVGQQIVSFYYSIPFHMISDAETVVDAVRYLYSITTKLHVKLYRVHKIQKVLHQTNPANDRNNHDQRFASLFLLLQLYEYYNPSILIMASETTATGYDTIPLPQMSTLTITGELSKFLQFPDDSWKQNFTTKVIDWIQNTTNISTSKNTNEESEIAVFSSNSSDVYSTLWATLDSLADATIHGIPSLIPWISTTKSTTTNPCKRQRLLRSVIRASDVLSNETVQHFIVLTSSTNFDAINSSTEWIRLRACLPYMLHEEWYEKGEGDEEEAANLHYLSRLRLLQALSSFASHTHTLPSEVVSFITHHMLPCYDASDIYEILFRDILPFCFFSSKHHHQAKIQSTISKLYPTASSSIQYAILSGGLTTFFSNLSELKRASTPTRGQLFQYAQWVDNLILTGLIAAYEEERKELILLSALDFYDAACDYCLCHTNSGIILLPSPSIIYKFLLSPTPVCIDRSCHLLLKYRILLEEAKKRNIKKNHATAKVGHSFFSCVEELERYIHIFNCYVADYCSSLWRCPDWTPFFWDDSATSGGCNSRYHSILWTDLSEGTLQELRTQLSDPHLQYTLSITHGAAFSGFASHFLVQQQHISSKSCPSVTLRISPNELTGSTKVKYLEYLRDVGFCGLHSFLTTFVNSLSTREAKKKNKPKNGS